MAFTSPLLFPFTFIPHRWFWELDWGSYFLTSLGLVELFGPSFTIDVKSVRPPHVCHPPSQSELGMAIAMAVGLGLVCLLICLVSCGTLDP